MGFLDIAESLGNRWMGVVDHDIERMRVEVTEVLRSQRLEHVSHGFLRGHGDRIRIGFCFSDPHQRIPHDAQDQA